MLASLAIIRSPRSLAGALDGTEQLDMTEYPAHSWASVVGFFGDIAEANTVFAPMRDFVERLASSRYATGLYPQQSMHTLRLSQSPTVSQEVARLSVDHEDGEFV